MGSNPGVDSFTAACRYNNGIITAFYDLRTGSKMAMDSIAGTGFDIFSSNMNSISRRKREWDRLS